MEDTAFILYLVDDRLTQICLAQGKQGLQCIRWQCIAALLTGLQRHSSENASASIVFRPSDVNGETDITKLRIKLMSSSFWILPVLVHGFWIFSGLMGTEIQPVSLLALFKIREYSGCSSLTERWRTLNKKLGPTYYKKFSKKEKKCPAILSPWYSGHRWKGCQLLGYRLILSVLPGVVATGRKGASCWVIV